MRAGLPVRESDIGKESRFGRFGSRHRREDTGTGAKLRGDIKVATWWVAG